MNQKTNHTTGEDDIEELRRDFHINKEKFEKEQWHMNINEVDLNNILLRIEEETYFNAMANKRRRMEEDFDTCPGLWLGNYPEFLETTETISNVQLLTIQNSTFDDQIITTANSQEIETKNLEEKEQIEIQEKTEKEYAKDANGGFYNEISGNESTYFQKENLGDRKYYKCNKPACTKKYLSSYGLKYHIEKGHKKKNVNKPYRCIHKGCNKRYKNANGLKYHLTHGHKSIGKNDSNN